MKIAIDCSHHLIAGGIRNYISNLLWALADEETGNQFALYYRGLQQPTAPPKLPEGSESTVVHVKAPRRMLYGLENRLRWPRLENWTGALDVVHGIHFTLPATRRRVRRILTVHDVTYLRHPEYYADTRLNDYGYRYLLSRSLDRCDGIIALSHSGKQDLIELCGVDPERIWVVPHGVDPELGQASEEDQERVRAKLGLERPFALYPVGTLEPRKNFRGTLEAFAKAFPKAIDRPDLVFTGVGEPPAEFSQIVDGLGLGGCVRLETVGYPDELAALMSAACWGMYPSLYEGFGLPPLECMACGLPMLVSNRTSCPEVAGDAALLVDPEDVDAMADGMRRLQEDEPLRTKLRQDGIERATSSGFRWERVARQVLAVYRDDRAAFDAEEQPLTAPGRVPMEVS